MVPSISNLEISIDPRLVDVADHRHVRDTELRARAWNKRMDKVLVYLNKYIVI